MKIGLVRQRYIAHGGAERYLNAVAAGLVKRGHEVHIFARDWDANVPDGNIVVHRVPTISINSCSRALSFAVSARREVERGRCDAVLSFERTLRQDIYRAGDGCHREYLIQRLRHSPSWKRATIWLNLFHATILWLERKVFSPQNTRLVIANSHRRKEEIIRHYGFPADRIQVLHNGVDCGRFRPQSHLRRRPFILLFAGSGFRGKGLEYCVRALAKLPEFVQLRVAGKGRPGRYERLARRLGIGSRVGFAGAQADMAGVYAASDLLVLPAIYESFANVCIEAMACGLPVVTSRINGAAEIIIEGVNGAVIEEAADVDGLAAAIRPFLDGDKWSAASLAARQTAESLPFGRNIEHILELIHGLPLRR